MIIVRSVSVGTLTSEYHSLHVQSHTGHETKSGEQSTIPVFRQEFKIGLKFRLLVSHIPQLNIEGTGLSGETCSQDHETEAHKHKVKNRDRTIIPIPVQTRISDMDYGLISSLKYRTLWYSAAGSDTPWGIGLKKYSPGRENCPDVNVQLFKDGIFVPDRGSPGNL